MDIKMQSKGDPNSSMFHKYLKATAFEPFDGAGTNGARGARESNHCAETKR
jgi:hypothetical protein